MPPRVVPLTTGTALQHIIEKNLGSQLIIQMQQQIGVFQASITQALQSFRDEIKSVKQILKGGWIHIVVIVWPSKVF